MIHFRSLRSLIFISSLAASLLACDKNYDTVFDELPDSRVRQALRAYDSLLVSAPFGWMATLYTGTGGGYAYYFDFAEGGSVRMLSDFNETAAGQPMTGTWAIKALQRPTLSFTTYSYVHLPADPDGSANGGANGEGLISDFEFAFVRTSGDSVIFEGIQRNTEMVLMKATEPEATAMLNKRILTVLQATRQYTNENRGLRLTLPDGTVLPLIVDVNRKIAGVQFKSARGDSIQLFQSPFTFTRTGMRLKSPFRLSGYTMDELRRDDEQATYFAQFNGNAQEIINDPEPYIFRLSPPLHQMMGSAYAAIQVPEGSGTSPLPGQSADFITAYNEAAASMLNGEFKLTLREMNFIVNPAASTLVLTVVVTQPTNGGAARYLAIYEYTYTKTDDGVFDFTLTGGNENAQIIAPDLTRILDHLEFDSFKMEYVGGDLRLLGGLFSQKEATFSLSGYLLAD